MTDNATPQETTTAPAHPTGPTAWVLGWFSQHKFLTIVLLLVGSCSFSMFDRHVSWEEEVPLNTGETIWVKRYVTYRFDITHDNPFIPSYIPDWTETLEFEWQGRRYTYTGAAEIMLIAISPLTKEPVLLANSMMRGWGYRNNYKCTTPYYVQFYPDTSGKHWSWPPRIEPWLYDLRYNLMYHRPRLNSVEQKYTTQDRKELDKTIAVQSLYLVSVDASYSSTACSR